MVLVGTASSREDTDTAAGNLTVDWSQTTGITGALQVSESAHQLISGIPFAGELSVTVPFAAASSRRHSDAKSLRQQEPEMGWVAEEYGSVCAL